MGKLAQYAKAAVAAVGVTATVVVALNVHATWADAIVAVATALGVYAVPNKKPNAGKAP